MQRGTMTRYWYTYIFPAVDHAPVFHSSVQFHCTFCMQRETQADTIVCEVSGCTVSECTVTSISWTGNPSRGPGQRRDKRKEKKAHLFFRILRHMQNFFRINLKLLTFLFALSFPILPPGVQLLVMSLILRFCHYLTAKRDKGLQTHTFLLSLSKAHIIFKTRSSWIYSSRQPLPKSYF